MWLITEDGARAFNLDHVKRIEASGSGEQRTLTGYVEGRAGEGGIVLASDLDDGEIHTALSRLAKGEGIDFRRAEGPFVA